MSIGAGGEGDVDRYSVWIRVAADKKQTEKDEASALSQLTIQSIAAEPEAGEANNKP